MFELEQFKSKLSLYNGALKQKEELAKASLTKSSQDINPPKRGKSPESLSDTANSLRRGIRDRLVAQDSSMALAYRFAVSLFDNNCYICGKPAYDSMGNAINGPIQADHVIPPIWGGAGAAGNMAPAHPECNNDKGDSDPEVYFVDQPETLDKLKILREVFDYTPVSPEIINDELEELVIWIFNAIITPWVNQKRAEMNIESDFVLPPSLKMPELADSSTNILGIKSRWAQTRRTDQHILNALNDVDEDSLGLYSSYSKFSSYDCSFDSRVDVKNRISRFVEIVEYVSQKNDLRLLTTSEFYSIMRTLELLFTKSPSELAKYRRLVRVLAEHPELAHLRDVAWDQEVL